ncbi:MAG: RDD family protein [Gammaproteobacteria bacterium]|nr:RDD family protein [Gammaproteobacteria bacterium]
MSGSEATPPAGFVRRLLAMVYDLILLLAVLYVAMGALLLITAGAANQPGSPWLSAYLLLVSFIFYGWFWINGGQTLGLRSWRLRVEEGDGRPLSWGVAMLRFSLGLLTCLPLGVGFLWMLVDRERRTLYDRLSGTRVVLLPPKPRHETE